MLSFGGADFNSILCRCVFTVNLCRRLECTSEPLSSYTYCSKLCYNSRYFQSIA